MGMHVSEITLSLTTMGAGAEDRLWLLVLYVNRYNPCPSLFVNAIKRLFAQSNAGDKTGPGEV